MLVLGAGTIGLLLGRAAQLEGAGHTAITARRPHQRDASEQLGIDATLEPGHTGGNWDVVFETVGGPSAETLDEALRSVRSGGCVVLLGLFHSPPQFDALALMTREIRLNGANCYGEGARESDFSRAAALLEHHGDELASALVTHCFPLVEFRSAIEAAANKQSGSIKVQVRPNPGETAPGNADPG